MLWEQSVSTAFVSSPNFSRVFLQLHRNTENMFSISLRKHSEEKFMLVLCFYQVIVQLSACAFLQDVF